MPIPPGEPLPLIPAAGDPSPLMPGAGEPAPLMFAAGDPPPPMFAAGDPPAALVVPLPPLLVVLLDAGVPVVPAVGMPSAVGFPFAVCPFGSVAGPSPGIR
jgi:hypothetical protein